ncbi:hypothetical protein N7517_002599 [Penicillium concentricum]|uniref:Uncharacterized protein n=1 Tax=Penicillium concentricum TaxID=293559 RepID=A0A9W9SXN5_9EURO|nr:uncharacterized protein N7517_002599 [Penicillium concentricum]KAJ5384688.1 hypothetical protein N7517_002599 [Penicillium concentricum]
MPGRGVIKDRVKSSNLTPRDYLENMKPEHLKFYWDTGDWTYAHGDGKGSTLGAYRLRSMKTTTEPAEYLIKVLYLNVKFLNFAMPGSRNEDGSTSPPTSQDIIDALGIELGKIGK